MWCTSRASPASTTSPTRVRDFSRTRCSCTAAVSSSDGMGAMRALELRSERMMTFEPRAMAMLTRRRTSSMASREGLAAAGGVEQPVDGEGLVAGRLPVLVDVGQLGQVVVVDHRVGQDDLSARRRRGLEQVALGPELGAARGDELLADGVERRVGHLGEQLGEVVEEQAGPLRQRRDGGVVAHRPERLAPAAGHGAPG